MIVTNTTTSHYSARLFSFICRFEAPSVSDTVILSRNDSVSSQPIVSFPLEISCHMGDRKIGSAHQINSVGIISTLVMSSKRCIKTAAWASTRGRSVSPFCRNRCLRENGTGEATSRSLGHRNLMLRKGRGILTRSAVLGPK